MDDLIGKSIGQYHILEILGEGGMATVYKAHDDRMDTDVAIKIIRLDALASSQDERLISRFEREAKALARLTDAHIVQIIDYGESEGRPFLVMPFLAGGTLKQRLQGKPIPWKDAAKTLLPIANELAYAHRQGIVHRDIKPSNILFTKSGDPMLTDFGIAKVSSEGSTMDATGTSVTMGTPEYMAPEQVLGQGVDARADIYSLGVVFYEMITGRKPFQADTPVAVLLKQANDPLPRPKRFARDLPEPVEYILVKALAKKPEDRYQSMAGFHDALEDYLRSGVSQYTKEDFSQRLNADKVRHPEGRAQPVPSASAGLWTVAGRILGSILILLIAGLLAPSAISFLGSTRPAQPPLSALLLTQTWEPTATLWASDTPTQTASPLPTPSVTPTATLLPSPPLISLKTGQVGPLGFFGNVVYRAVWSPDGKSLAIVFPDRIDLDDSQALTLVRSIKTNQVFYDIAYSPDGKLLAGGARDGTVTIWKTADGSALHSMNDHRDGVDSVAFSPDGTLLATGSYDETIQIWQVSDGTAVTTLSGHAGAVTGVAFTPDGKTLISGSLDGTVRLWRVSDGSVEWNLTGFSAGITGIALSSDGSLLATGSQDGSLTLWRVSDRTLLKKLAAPDSVFCVVLSPDGSNLAAGLGNGTIAVYRTENGEIRRQLSGQTDGIDSLSFSPDGNTLISGSYDQSVWFWWVSNGAPLKKLDGKQLGILSIAFTPDGKTLASGDLLKKTVYSPRAPVQIWDIQKGTIEKEFQFWNCRTCNPEASDRICSVDISPDGNLLLVSGLIVKFKEVETAYESWWPGCNSAVFSPDGTIYAEANGYGVAIHKSSDEYNYSYQVIKGNHQQDITSVAFSPDGKTVASASLDWTVELANISSRKLLRTLNGNAGGVFSIAFSPDGSILASGTRDGTIILWRVSDGRLLRTLKGHSAKVTSVVFSPDGMILASGSADHSIRLWRVSDGTLLRTLVGHSNEVTDVIMSRDGLLMASGSVDGTIRLWGVP